MTLSVQDALAAGDLATASRLADAAIQQYPNDGGLINLRGVVHARRNELSQARSDFAQAVRLAPMLVPAWQNLARACQMAGDQDDSAVRCAVNAWERTLQLKPGDGEAHSSLALLYERQRQFARSLGNLKALAPETAKQTFNLLLRCADLSALGRMQEAMKAAEEISARSDFAESDYFELEKAFDAAASADISITLIQALDRRNAATLPSLERLAIAYEQTKRFSEARKTLERVALLDPKNTAHLLELARLADQSKDYEGALGYLGHARDLEPQNARIHFLFGTTAARMNLPIEARRSLDRALALDPQNPDYNYAMGSVILATRDAATSATYFQKFVTARPDNPAGHYALGIAYFTSGDYDNAKAEMAKVKSGPIAGVEYFLGRIARLEGRLDDALSHEQKSIELMPGFAESHTELARAYLDRGELDKAHDELDRAVKLDPDSFLANSQLLVLYRRTHDSRAAQQQQRLSKLDQERSRRAELMLRTVEVRP